MGAPDTTKSDVSSVEFCCVVAVAVVSRVSTCVVTLSLSSDMMSGMNLSQDSQLSQIPYVQKQTVLFGIVQGQPSSVNSSMASSSVFILG